MKSFKTHLMELKKIYTRKEMIDWGIKNIKYFDIRNNGEENLNKDGESLNGFKISEAKQTFYRVIPDDTKIITDETFIPFIFDLVEGITIIAPNLKEFSFEKTIAPSGGNVDAVTFEQCNSLDFSNLDYLDDMVICFKKTHNILPQYLCKTRFIDIQFQKCKNEHIYDFSNYDNMYVDNLEISMVGIKLRNVSNIIEKENIFIETIRIFYAGDLISELYDILNKYLVLDNKSEHIMDFTVEMIDAGFEDML